MAEFGDAIDSKFPPGLSREQKAALLWRIERDYITSDYGAVSFKDEFLSFAINFYTRNSYSLEEVMAQHSAFVRAKQRKELAQAFLADMRSRIPEYDNIS